MDDVKIIKLPTMGQPFSFKTRKQGRRDSIDYDIVQSNKVSIEISRRERYDKAKQLGNYLEKYIGNDPFLISLRSQMKAKGLHKLTIRQIDTGFKTLKKNLTKDT